MSVESCRAYYAANREFVLRVQAARKRARRLGFSMRQSGQTATLLDADGTVVVAGSLDHIEVWLAGRYQRPKPGPDSLAAPRNWQACLDVFTSECHAAKRRPGTTRLRLLALGTFARSMPGSDPLTVTRDDLIGYLGRAEWSPAYVHSLRSTFRVFFRVLYDLGYRRDNPARYPARHQDSTCDAAPVPGSRCASGL